MRVLEQLLAPFRRPTMTTSYPAMQPALEDRRSRGTPVRFADACSDDGACEEACPTDAITIADGGDTSAISTWRLDYGRCIFCGECSRACASGAITTTADFELAVTTRAAAIATQRIPVVPPSPSADGERLGVRER